MLAIGAKLCEATVIDRRDHPAEGLADPAEGDALLDRHPRGESTDNGGSASVTTVPFLGAGTAAFGRNPSKRPEAALHLSSNDLPRAQTTPPRPNAEQDSARAGRART